MSNLKYINNKSCTGSLFH